MKKIFLGFAVTAGSLAFAQKTEEIIIVKEEKIPTTRPITFGVKAGMNISNLTKDRYFNEQKDKIGFNVGGFVNIPLSSKFSLQPELLYSNVGSKVSRTYKYGEGDINIPSTFMNNEDRESYTRSLNYLSIPVMLQYNIIPNLYLEAGPQFDVFLGGKNKGETTVKSTPALGGSTTTTTTSSNNIKGKEAAKFNLGLGIGAGYYFLPNIGITVRYVAGLSDINNSRKAGENSVKMNLFQLGLAYKF